MTYKAYPRVLALFVVFFASSFIHAQETLPELVRRVKPTVVAITTYDANGEVLMTGSGFFVGSGRVVTNLHVVRGAIRAEIKTLDGKGRIYPVTGALAIDEEGDLALLELICLLREAVFPSWQRRCQMKVNRSL